MTRDDILLSVVGVPMGTGTIVGAALLWLRGGVWYRHLTGLPPRPPRSEAALNLLLAGSGAVMVLTCGLWAVVGLQAALALALLSVVVVGVTFVVMVRARQRLELMEIYAARAAYPGPDPAATAGGPPPDDRAWADLPRAVCFARLAGAVLGRIAVVDDLGLAIFPVNFVLDQDMIVFRTAAGTKLDAAVRGARVAFEVDGFDAVTRTGWSVLVRGEAVELTSPAEIDRLDRLIPPPWVPAPRAHLIRILPALVSGRRIAVGERVPVGDQPRPEPGPRGGPGGPGAGHG